MISNETYFYLYIIVILILLIILSVFVFFQVKSFFINWILHLFVFYGAKNITFFSEETYYTLLGSYFSRAQYFNCILLCELFLEKFSSSDNKKYFYINLADTYAQIEYWSISEYYYLKALSIYGQDMRILSKLANIYVFLGYKSRAKILLNRFPTTDVNV